MPALTWHPDALDDVARLYDFLLPHSPEAARRAASVILQGADFIAANPQMGTPHVEFREWPAKFGRSAYVIRYILLDGDEVLVTRVWPTRELRSAM